MTSTIKDLGSLEVPLVQSVPRQMVHKSALTEVFLTAGTMLEADHFQCISQLPRTNIYFNDCLHDCYEMLLLIELFRQASIYVSHAYIGVSVTDKFLYVDSDTTIVNRNILVMGQQSAVGVIDIHIVDKYHRRGSLQGVTFDMKLLIDGEVAARHDGMTIRWMSEELWNRMREKGLSQVSSSVNAKYEPVMPMNPRTVGRSLIGNVVIGSNIKDSQTEITTELLIPFGNGAIFDHPLDHIPGMLLLENFRQTALAAEIRDKKATPEGLVLERCAVKFEQFGELGYRTTCHIQKENLIANEDGLVFGFEDMLIKQQGSIIAKASLSFVNQSSTCKEQGFVQELAEIS